MVAASGLTHCPRFCVNSTMVGSEKPHPPIFQEVLRLSGVAPHEGIHIGDQVRSDVAGARAMGMHAALLERGGWHDAPDGCPKIATLDEVMWLLESEGELFQSSSAQGNRLD